MSGKLQCAPLSQRVALTMAGRKGPVRPKGTLLMAASEFQRTLMTYLSRQGVSVTALARQTGYSPVLLENLIAGKSRQMPVDFFVRIADALDLTIEEKDDL